MKPKKTLFVLLVISFVAGATLAQEPPVNPGTPDTVRQLREEAAKDRAQAQGDDRRAQEYRELAQEQRKEAARRRDPADKKIALDIAVRREAEAKQLEDGAARLRQQAKEEEERAARLEKAYNEKFPTPEPPREGGGSVMGVSARRMMLIPGAKRFAPGEFFDISIMVPSPRSDVPPTGHLYWAVASNRSWQEKESMTGLWAAPGGKLDDAFTRGTQKLRLYAPFQKLAGGGKDNRFELLLFQGGNELKLLDSVEVIVRIDQIPDALKLTKTSFNVGEPIDFTVKLPPNRYYYGDWGGPSVMLYPLEFGGSRVSDEEARQWSEPCTGPLPSCSTWLLTMTRASVGPNPYGGSFAIKPGTYVVTHDYATALVAPKQPGRYEVRLYDRGFAMPLNDYVDLYFAKEVITVTNSPATPSAPPQPPRPAPTKYTEIIQVPVDGTLVTTKTVLKRGVLYSIQVSGTAIVGGPAGGIGDAEYFAFSRSGGPLNSCALSPTKNLDVGLSIDDGGSGGNKSPNWGKYNPVHLYKTTVIGSGLPMKFKYRDCDYSDNQGSLTVQIR